MPLINYTVGQVVCIVITLSVKNPVPLKAEVIKVGRKWVNLRTIDVYPALQS